MPLNDATKVSDRLVSRFGYDSKGAGIVAAKLAVLQPALANAAQQWWDAGTPITLSVQGYTVNSLKTETGMNDIAAILTLDWLIREPEKATIAIKRGGRDIKRPAPEGRRD